MKADAAGRGWGIGRVWLGGVLLAAMGVLLLQCRSRHEPRDPAEQGRSLGSEQQAGSLPRLVFSQTMMGTRFVITVYAEDPEQVAVAAAGAFRLAAEVDDACSDYDVNSELMRLNAAPAGRPFSLSPLLLDVLSRALEMAKQSGGAYDPTLGHHSYQWRMARKKRKLPSGEAIQRARALSGWQHLELDSRQSRVKKQIDGMRLDLGGIAKGYAAEMMFRYLVEQGFSQVSVVAGGEVRLGEPPPGQDGWRVSLKTLDQDHRLSPSSMILADCAISSSGDLHQSFRIDGQRYSHICDPSTGLGLTRRVSATVIGRDATRTDALATALCVRPGFQPSEVDYLIIQEDSDGGLQAVRSPGWRFSTSP